MSKKRYTVKDNKTGDEYHYTWWEWHLAFVLIFCLGAVWMLIIFYLTE